MTPGQRIKQLLDERGLSAQDLAKHLGLTRQAVSLWWADSRPPTSPLGTRPGDLTQIKKIARFFNVSVEWLMSVDSSPPPLPARIAHAPEPAAKPAPPPRQERRHERHEDVWSEPDDDHSRIAIDLAVAPVVCCAEGEVWREGRTMREILADRSELAHAPIVPAVPRPDTIGMRQFAIEARGSHADRVIRAGEFCVCVDFQAYRPNGPHEGDLVVLERRRKLDGHAETKIKIARLRYYLGAWELHFESNDPMWRARKPIRLDENLAHALDANSQVESEIELVGFVLGVFRPLTGETNSSAISIREALARVRERTSATIKAMSTEAGTVADAVGLILLPLLLYSVQDSEGLVACAGEACKLFTMN